jgi:probable rRNA maturation factor
VTRAVAVEVSCRDSRVPLDPGLLRTLVRLVEAGESRALPVSISIVGDAEIRRLNRDFLDHDEATDVIAFDLSDGIDASVSGEVVVSAECAERVARELGHAPAWELCFYVCHGLLHLCGWDDADPADRDRMLARQAEYLQELGVARG